jgi:integrase
MATVPRKLKNRTVFYVANYLADGSQVWEHAGADKRAAERRDAAMKREIKAGTYTGKPTGATSVRGFHREWHARRTNRTAGDELSWWNNHVVERCPWFLAMRLDDVLYAHVAKLKRELEAPYMNADGKTVTLSRKSVFNLFAPINTMFGDAFREGLISRNPCDWPRGSFNSRATKKRTPYNVEEVLSLTTDPRLPEDWAMFTTLYFYAGLREGEGCGLRFCDWDRRPEPLGSLAVDSQYNDRPLKTGEVVGDNARTVPVHPALARALEAWWAKGFERVFCRKPSEDDFIVPCRSRDLRNHTRSSAYKLFRRICDLVGVQNRSLHSTRHTFITLSRRDGARKDVLENVTHNAEGKTIDAYTHWEWEPLCEAVGYFMSKSTPPRRHLKAV